MGVYIAETTIIVNTGDSPFDGLTVRGNTSQIVLVNNTLNNFATVQPQNTTAIEFVSDALFEGNLMASTVGDGNAEFWIRAKHVVVRNNVFSNAAEAVQIQDTPQLTAGWVDQIYVENNTAYYPSTGTHGFSDFLVNGTTGVTTTIRNNLFLTKHAQPDTFGNAVFFLPGSGNTYVEDHNLMWCTASTCVHPSGTGDLFADPILVNATPTVVGDFAIQTTSPAKNAGTSTSALIDYLGVSRVATFDMGAFEFVTASSVTLGKAALFFGGGP